LELIHSDDIDIHLLWGKRNLVRDVMVQKNGSFLAALFVYGPVFLRDERSLRLEGEIWNRVREWNIDGSNEGGVEFLEPSLFLIFTEHLLDWPKRIKSSSCIFNLSDLQTGRSVASIFRSYCNVAEGFISPGESSSYS
jgi:hypothetical protein